MAAPSEEIMGLMGLVSTGAAAKPTATEDSSPPPVLAGGCQGMGMG